MRESMQRSVFFWILAGGLAAATVDIAAASLINWRNPAFILQFIASGLIGASVVHLGFAGVVLGLILQWLMGVIIASIFFLAALLVGRARVLSGGRWIAAALGYGVVIFVVMNYIVMPLSAVHRVPHFTSLKAIENLLAMFLFALIVALCARPAPRLHPHDVAALSSPPSSV